MKENKSEPTELQKKEHNLRSQWVYYQNQYTKESSASTFGNLKRFTDQEDENVINTKQKMMELEQEVFKLQGQLNRKGLPILPL